MLKNIALTILTVISSLFGIKNITNNNYSTAVSTTTSPEISPTATSLPQPKNVISQNYENKDYLIYYTKLTGKKIELIPNFSQKLSSQTIIKEAKCASAVNGGFYTKEGEPLGLFIANGKVYQEEAVNKTLLTGFFYLDESGLPVISDVSPANSSFALQAGPLIINENPLSTTNDEPSRRVVLAQDVNNTIYALAIVDKEDPYLGPLLADLPPIIFNINSPFKISKALNLDGGSASVFYGEDGFILSELTSVGSVICVR